MDSSRRHRLRNIRRLAVKCVDASQRNNMAAHSESMEALSADIVSDLTHPSSYSDTEFEI